MTIHHNIEGNIARFAGCGCDGGQLSQTSHTISVPEERSMLRIKPHISRDAFRPSTDSKSISRLNGNDDTEQGS
jgi:hypothetical protein